MTYDFTTRVDRRGLGSSKWEMMFARKPGVSPDVVPLSVADMELLNPPEIVEGLREFIGKAVLGYTRATPAYTQAVRDWMWTRRGWAIEDDWICLSPGVVPALFDAVNAFTQPGEGVIIMPPVYYPFRVAVEQNGRTVARNPLALVGGEWRIDFDDLEEKARDPRNTLLILCSPHNPVGRVWTRDELERVAEICLRHRVLVISDEIHFDLLMPGVTHTVYATLSDEAARNCVVCTAPSKTFNLAGMQASNIMIPDPALRERFKAQAMTHGGGFQLGILGYKACEIAYTRCGPWLDQFLALLATNHRIVKDFMAQRIPRVTVFPLEGTYLQWLDFRAFGLDAAALESFMVNDAEWFLDEGAMFGEEGAGFERVNLACPTATLQAALDRLYKALQSRRLV